MKNRKTASRSDFLVFQLANSLNIKDVFPLFIYHTVALYQKAMNEFLAASNEVFIVLAYSFVTVKLGNNNRMF